MPGRQTVFECWQSGQANASLPGIQQHAGSLPQEGLRLVIDARGIVQMGTCAHCVLLPARPDNSWDTDGDSELDFPRDLLVELFASYGVQLEIVEEYLCP